MMHYYLKVLGYITIVAINGLALAYTSSELCTINWGDGHDQIKITRPVIDGIPSDSTDYNIEPGDGPSNIFVDYAGYLIVLSPTLRQLKVFSNDGELLFNLWPPEGKLDPEIFHGYPSSIYIDSAQRIYLAVSPSLNYVPVINYEGQLTNRLYPFDDTLTEIEDICCSSLDRAVFYSTNDNEATLSNNTIVPGGTCAFMASDSCYYSCITDQGPNILFFRNHIQDLKHHIFSSDSIIVEFPGDTVFSANIIPGGDGRAIFTYLMRWSSEKDCICYEIFVNDLKFNKIDLIEMSPPTLMYTQIITPFVSRDGIIYEFQYRDDGLHVIKWTKQ
jgi:hypothetical protein